MWSVLQHGCQARADNPRLPNETLPGLDHITFAHSALVKVFHICNKMGLLINDLVLYRFISVSIVITANFFNK